MKIMLASPVAREYIHRLLQKSFSREEAKVGLLALVYIINIAISGTLHTRLNSILYNPIFVVEMLSRGSLYP